jgi:hypothetical protein
MSVSTFDTASVGAHPRPIVSVTSGSSGADVDAHAAATKLLVSHVTFRYGGPVALKEVSIPFYAFIYLGALERFPSDMNRDSQRGGKDGVLAGDSACEATHGQTLFTGLTGTCDWSG